MPPTMFVFRLIPGALWLDVLDKVTDQCHTFLGWRLPCSMLVLFAWMSLLGELRVQAVKAVKYVVVVYYRPNKVAIHKFFGHWQVRLGFCSLICGTSYYFTFEFEEDFPYLQELKESIQNERYTRDVDEAEGGEIFLMAHVFVQRFLQQTQALVWVLGTVLRLKRNRFWKLAALVSMAKPMGSFLVAYCGNYALWLLIGHTMLRFFDLSPEGYPKFGQAGCYTAVLASTIYWKKYGTMEILVTVTTAIGTEIAWRKFVMQVREEKAKRGQQKKGITDRIFAFFADLVVPDDGVDAFSNAKKDDDKAAKEKETPAYTRPSLYAWVAIAVYWMAVGIRLDGYDLSVV